MIDGHENHLYFVKLWRILCETLWYTMVWRG